MPRIGEHKDLIVLSKVEWEELEQLDKGDYETKEDGSLVYERRIIVSSLRYYKQEGEKNTYYPYITFYDEEGKEHLRRIPKTDNLHRTRVTSSENEGTLVLERENSNYLVEEVQKLIRNGKIKEKVKDLVIGDSMALFSWIKTSLEKHANLPNGYFPIAIIFREILNNKSIVLGTQVNRNFYQIVPVSNELVYLGECKYRG